MLILDAPNYYTYAHSNDTIGLCVQVHMHYVLGPMYPVTHVLYMDVYIHILLECSA